MDINHPNYKKIDKTFNRVMNEINKFEKAFKAGGKLEKAVLELDGNAFHINEVARELSNAYDALEDAHYNVLNESVNESEKRWKQTSMSPQEAIAKYGKENVKVKKGALRNGDDMVEVFVESMNEAGGYYTQPVYDMIKQHGYPKVMHRLLSALDADVIQDALSTMNTENESYSPGDEMEDGVVSNCCGAQLMD